MYRIYYYEYVLTIEIIIEYGKLSYILYYCTNIVHLSKNKI